MSDPSGEKKPGVHGQASKRLILRAYTIVSYSKRKRVQDFQPKWLKDIE